MRLGDASATAILVMLHYAPSMTHYAVYIRYLMRWS
jgi:hypothetical protein